MGSAGFPRKGISDTQNRKTATRHSDVTHECGTSAFGSHSAIKMVQQRYCLRTVPLLSLLGWLVKTQIGSVGFSCFRANGCVCFKETLAAIAQGIARSGRTKQLHARKRLLERERKAQVRANRIEIYKTMIPSWRAQERARGGNRQCALV